MEKSRKAPEGRGSHSNERCAPSNAMQEKRVKEAVLYPVGSDGAPTHHEMEEGSLTPAPTAKLRLISQRKLEANRRNARRSSGPRTAEGKARSRCNALRHGLRCEKVLFGSDRMPTDPELQATYENLQRHYGRDETETDALLRSTVVELSHQRRAMELEESCLQNALDGSSAVIRLDHLRRYRTTSQRALLQHLAQLHRLPETEVEPDEGRRAARECRDQH